MGSGKKEEWECGKFAHIDIYKKKQLILTILLLMSMFGIYFEVANIFKEIK